jgi:2,3-bisphosphoglycerate-dependent phosphoglycerate mutase
MSHQLILLRHGQSEWNRANLFTGFHDVALSAQGRQEATTAGELLRAEGLAPDVVHTSLLKRAITTANLALESMDREWLPVKRHWRLNERHYGVLQGLDKKATADKHGKEQVFTWRRSYDVPPPPLDADDERHPRHDARYRGLPPEVLPSSECLADVVRRVLPYWQDSIAPDLYAGHCVLLVAHGNSLRALVKHLDTIDDEQITGLNIPTGIPLLYELDDALRPTGKRYLGDPEAAEKAAEAVARQAG